MKNFTPGNNKNLATLCRSHYDGLLLVCKIRKSMRQGIEINTIINFIREEFTSHLQPHLIEEEEWLLPKLPEDNPLRIQAETQHEAFRRMAITFSGSTLIPPSLPEEFADLLEEHIRFEERTLFPFVEKIMSAQ